METKELTCIICPRGCRIRVQVDGGDIMNMEGHTCRRGADYARREMTHPMRTVTGTMRVTGGASPVVSVKTKPEIPKEKIPACAAVLKASSAAAPIAIGDVLIANVAGTGADIVATKAVFR